MKTVEFSTSALAKLRSLEADDRRQIGYALHLFATTDAGDVKKLKDLGGERRLRVGDWRIRFVEDPPGTSLYCGLTVAIKPTRNKEENPSQQFRQSLCLMARIELLFEPPARPPAVC